jgi:hypothetical protein
MPLRTLFQLALSLTLFCGALGVSCAAPMNPTLNRVAKAACSVLSELASETDSPYIEMAERFLRSGDLHSARDQLLRYLTMVKFDEDVLALIQLIESQIPPELPKMLDPPSSPHGAKPEPIEDIFGLPVDLLPPSEEPKAPILD